MTNREATKCLNEVLKPDADIVLVVETDNFWKKAFEPLSKKYPYNAQLPLDNTYGMIFYSKLPFENGTYQYLVEDDIPSLHPIIKLKSGVKVQCHFIHPKPPAPQEAKTSEERDAELIIVAKKAKAAKLPVIVAGDLNDVGWSHTSKLFQKISGLLDPRIGRGLFATFNAKYPFLRWPLDHVFHSKEFRVLELKKLGHTGSDHFPIYIKLSYEPEKKHEQESIEKDHKDELEAQEKLDKVR